MCRTGGRRCPSHSDPVVVAARNARRRAAYANRTHPVSGYTQEMVALGKDKTIHPELNISTVTASGELAENLYFDSTQVSGQINYNELDEESYQDFGFPEIDEYDVNVLPTSETISNHKLVKQLSEQELAGLTPEEREAVNLFTTDEFLRINGELYNIDYEGGLIDESEMNYDLDQVLTDMDNVFTKTPNFQRTVYRGMGVHHTLFRDNGSEYNLDVADYVAENYQLGSELVFDGYQSSTTDPQVGLEFAGNQGLLFQIKTANGLNISSASKYDSEKEILLPRKARYMVVGVHDSVMVKNDAVDDCVVTIVQLAEIDEQGYVTGGQRS